MYRAAAPDESGDRRRGRRLSSCSSSTSGATGLFDGNRSTTTSPTNPRRTMGEMWLEGCERRAAPGRRGAAVVEAAPAARGRARLRPRPRRHLRRRRLRVAAAPRRRPPRATARRSRTPRATTSPTCACRRRSTLAARGTAHRASQRSTPAGGGESGHRSRPSDHSQRRTAPMKRRTLVAATRDRRRASPCALGLAAGAQAQTVLKFSHTDQPGGARHKAAELFGQKIEQYTQGRYKLQVFPAGQLANDPEGDRAAAAGRHRLHGVVDRLVRDAPRRAQPDDAAVPRRELRAGLEALRRVEVAAGASSPRRRRRASASSPPGRRASAT